MSLAERHSGDSILLLAFTTIERENGNSLTFNNFDTFNRFTTAIKEQMGIELKTSSSGFDELKKYIVTFKDDQLSNIRVYAYETAINSRSPNLEPQLKDFLAVTRKQRIMNEDERTWNIDIGMNSSNALVSAYAAKLNKNLLNSLKEQLEAAGVTFVDKLSGTEHIREGAKADILNVEGESFRIGLNVGGIQKAKQAVKGLAA